MAKRAVRKKAVTKRSSAKARAGSKKGSAKRSTAKRSKKASPKRRVAARRAAPKKKTKTIGKRKTAARAAASRSGRKHPTPEPSRLSAAATTVRGVVAGAVAAVANRLPWTSSDLDAIAFLEKDHRRFEDLLKQGEDTTERAVKGRTELLNTLTALTERARIDRRKSPLPRP